MMILRAPQLWVLATGILIYFFFTDATNAAALQAEDGSTTPSDEDFNECLSLGCFEQATVFKKQMNENIKPCDDFYHFVCGGLIEKPAVTHKAPESTQVPFFGNSLTTLALHELQREIKPKELNAIKNAKKHYQNCMEENNIEEKGTSPVLELLEKLGSWPVLMDHNWIEDNYDWKDTVTKVNQEGLKTTFPFKLYVNRDSQSSSKNIIKMASATTTVNDAYVGESDEYVKSLENFMIDIAVMLGANRDVAIREMKECLDFEIKLHKIKSSLSDLQDVSPAESRKSFKELSEKYEDIPWLDLANKVFNPSGIYVQETDEIEIEDPIYISKIGQLTKETSKKVLANYQIWQQILELIDYMPKKFIERKFAFKQVMEGTDSLDTREKQCMNKVMDELPIAVNAMFIRKYTYRTLKNAVKEIVDNIKAQIQENLQTIDWMDKETKNYALEKLQAMSAVIAYPDELSNDTKIEEYYNNLNIDIGNYINDYIRITKFSKDTDYKNLRESVKYWTKEAAVVTEMNAYYNALNNSIIIPAGIIKKPFYRVNVPEYLNYGTLGFIIGHEITHGFDNRGSKYDKNGNYYNWWLKVTEDKMKEKSKCLEDQYSNYTVSQVGIKVNGKLTLGENIADNGGIKLAYKAYKKWATDNGIVDERLPELNYTPKQMFWISAATIFCNRLENKELQNALIQDIHSPGDARITITFSNNEDFANDFKCKVGSKMYPEKRCKVW